MYYPQFPYNKDQVIISSNRVILHSKEDAIFLFGKQAVSLSSTNTINLDSKNSIIVSCPSIYLGNVSDKKTEFQPTILGSDFVNDLTDILVVLKKLSDQLSHINETNFSAFATAVRSPAILLSDMLNRKILEMPKILSKNTFVK